MKRTAGMYVQVCLYVCPLCNDLSPIYTFSQLFQTHEQTTKTGKKKKMKSAEIRHDTSQPRKYPPKPYKQQYPSAQNVLVGVVMGAVVGTARAHNARTHRKYYTERTRAMCTYVHFHTQASRIAIKTARMPPFIGFPCIAQLRRCHGSHQTQNMHHHHKCVWCLYVGTKKYIRMQGHSPSPSLFPCNAKILERNASRQKRGNDTIETPFNIPKAPVRSLIRKPPREQLRHRTSPEPRIPLVRRDPSTQNTHKKHVEGEFMIHGKKRNSMRTRVVSAPIILGGEKSMTVRHLTRSTCNFHKNSRRNICVCGYYCVTTVFERLPARKD